MGSSKLVPVEGVAPVMAHWQFELEDGSETWRGFSPAVSGSLEVAFEQWAADPARGAGRPARLRTDNFIYAVDFASMLELGEDASPRRLQRIRRISVSELDRAQACIVEPTLWSAYQANAKDSKCTKQESQALEQELAELRLRCARLEDEVSRLGRQLAARPPDDAEPWLRPLLGGAVYPGRLVQFKASDAPPVGCEHLPAAHRSHDQPSLGRARCVEGSMAEVDFGGSATIWLPRANLEPSRAAELMTRPGTRVRWEIKPESDEGEEETEADEALEARDGAASPLRPPCRRYARGVVCGLAAEGLPAGLHVEVLGPDGTKATRCIGELVLDDGRHRSRPRGTLSGWRVGDRVVLGRSCSQESGEVADGELAVISEIPISAGSRAGMVVRRTAAGLCVRLPAPVQRLPRAAADSDTACGELGQHLSVGSCDVEVPHGSVVLEEAADGIRPGVAVRLRQDSAALTCGFGGEQAAVGTVYAVHADGSAVVDFLGCMGVRLDLAMLEVVDLAPCTVEYSILCLLSESFGWQEACARHWEGEVDDG
mmetsp:Transcript_13288/g.42877  ORF Transcript_13288/g.42877 Transcript_13288/m.42877 type:complete len:542 (-) Transcript_13288:25-1650(-)